MFSFFIFLLPQPVIQVQRNTLKLDRLLNNTVQLRYPRGAGIITSFERGGLMANMCFESTPITSANQRCWFSCWLRERELQKVVYVISTLESPQHLTQRAVKMRHIIYNPSQIIYRKHKCLYSNHWCNVWLSIGHDKQYVVTLLDWFGFAVSLFVCFFTVVHWLLISW